jgi:hypothetical protein
MTACTLRLAADKQRSARNEQMVVFIGESFGKQSPDCRDQTLDLAGNTSLAVLLTSKKTPCQTLAIKRVNGRAEFLELRYLTTSVALPPLLLRTVTLCGLTGQVNSARNLPLPWFERVPISCPFEVTNACRVALALLLVASTRSLRLPSYSARVIATESGAGVACGVTVKPTLRVTPPELPLKVAGVRAAT